MKKRNILRTTAVTLAALTAFSATSIGVTTASAASARDIGLSAANKSVDALVEMGAECIPGGKILGAAGCAILDGIFGNIMSHDDGPSSQDIDDHITRSTNEIKEDINTMSQRMTTYHNAEMIKLTDMSQMLKETQAQQKMTAFEIAYNETVTANNDFINGIGDNYISNKFVNDDYQLIDEDTKESFDYILKTSNISHQFSLMNTYLGGDGSDRYSNFYSLMGDLLKTEYDNSVYNALTKEKSTYVLGVTTEDELSKLISYDSVEKELKGYQADMLTYYGSCVQAAQMQYDISNYEYYYKHINDQPTAENPKDGKQLCKDHLAVTQQTFLNKIDTLRSYMDNITRMFNNEMNYLESCKAADISLTVNGKDYSISFDDAGMACFTLNNFVYKDKTDEISNPVFNFDNDLKLDSVLGMTKSKEFCDVLKDHSISTRSFRDLINSIQKDKLKDQKGYDFTINLNGHSVDMSEITDLCFIGGFITSGNLTINGQGGSITSAGFFFHDVFERDNYYKNLTFNNVTLNEIKNASNSNIGMIMTIGKYHVYLNNSVLNSYLPALYQENGSDVINNNSVINQL